MNEDSKIKLRTRLRQVTEAAILEATEEVVAELGLEGASMQAIAQRAGASVGTLYNYFENRDDLMRGLLRSRREELHAGLEVAARAPADGLRQRLSAMVRAVLTHFETHRRFVAVAVDSERLRSLIRGPEEAPPWRPVWVQLEDRVRDVLAEAVAAGELRSEGAELWPSLLVGLVRAVLLRRLRQPEVALVGEAERIVRFFLDGAAVRTTS